MASVYSWLAEWATILGLALDLVGFALVFAFGGFEAGRAGLLLQGDRSREMKKYKVAGAFMVVAGFALQLVGALVNQ